MNEIHQKREKVNSSGEQNMTYTRMNTQLLVIPAEGDHLRHPLDKKGTYSRDKLGYLHRQRQVHEDTYTGGQTLVIRQPIGSMQNLHFVCCYLLTTSCLGMLKGAMCYILQPQTPMQGCATHL